eukprot:gnl/MRDRNA2_/MRDRNA2_52069_c0_seq1.p1 gnl/MRDRNA2_/MRDRNA2_52069_c0~~gnl/MRDRNA2_/MRDRNA2_52069_c0_seq1.p1  ORF type:complete len:778 (+),score=231.46 gnl/MRDRNA2_/MRDRNA2_52069_c0_seq1:143-2335(+)
MTSPVQKVITLLEQISAKVESDMQEQTAAFQEYARYCDVEANAKTHAISDSKDQIDTFSAAIIDAEAVIEVATAKIEESSAAISDAEKELKSSQAIREKENEDFLASEKELVETVDSLGRAGTVLKKTMAFAQMSKATKQRIVNAVKSLGMIVEASFVTHEQKSRIEAFLQAHDQASEDSDDGFSVKAEQPEEKPSSSAIVDTIADMQEKAEATLSSTRKEEMKAAHSAAMLKQSLETQLASLNKEMKEAKTKKQATTEVLATNQKDKSVEEKALTETEAFLSDLKHECQSKAADFEVAMKDMQNEMEALQKGKAILTKQFGSAAASSSASFIQTSQRSRLHSRLRSASRHRYFGQVEEQDESAFGDRKMLALRSIEQLGRKIHSSVLVSLAFRAASDPFGKIRGMIEEMIAKLLQEAAEEADQKAFCDKEIGESKISQDDKQEKLDTLDARIGTTESDLDRLSGEVKVLQGEILEIDKATQEVTKIRQREAEDFEKNAKDYAESEEACAAAIQVLQEYYEGGSLLQEQSVVQEQNPSQYNELPAQGANTEDPFAFIQMRSKSRMKSRAKMHAKSRARFLHRGGQHGGEGILGMLEIAESDFASMLAESKAAEQQAVQEFEKVINENRVLKATKFSEIKGKESEMKGLKTKLDELSQDKSGVTSELAAVNEYLDKLKPQCDRRESYADKKARREQEIAGLKDALSILEGDGIALMQSRAPQGRLAVGPLY